MTVTVPPLMAYHDLVLACPFSDKFRRHTKAELAAMRESIKAHGIHESVKLYTDATLNRENCLLDGEGRLTVAAELGLPYDAVRFEQFGELTTDAAYDLACDFNDSRRQDDPSAVEKRKREREERHKRLHEVIQKRDVEGKSFRTIAAELGVSHVQAQNDYKDAHAGGKGLPPETVKGKDGKEYPASKPKPPEPVVTSPPAPPPPPIYETVPIIRSQVPRFTESEFDWTQLETAIGTARKELDAAAYLCRMLDSPEYKEGLSLLNEFEMLIYSDKPAHQSWKRRYQHAEG